MTEQNIRLGITLGDANGVGPEILLRAWAAGKVPSCSIVFGDIAVLDYCSQTLGCRVPIWRVSSCHDARDGALNVFDCALLTTKDITPGRISAVVGRASLAYLHKALTEALAGHISAIVTLPVSKAAVRLSEPTFRGHTDVIAGVCPGHEYAMTLVSEQMIVAHVSAHVSLRDAIELLSPQRIQRVIEVTASLAERLDRRGSIGVLGLNPHAGEMGAFGHEEIEVIEPAVHAARAAGLEVVGPLPPDTAFMRALRGDFRALVCMYHDQGHIVMKTLGFDDTVNVTAGLPIVRTSVDHGTAFDIAYKGIASIGSFVHACRLALLLSARK